MTASPQLLASRFVSVLTLLIAALNAALLFASDALAELAGHSASPPNHPLQQTAGAFADSRVVASPAPAAAERGRSLAWYTT